MKHLMIAASASLLLATGCEDRALTGPPSLRLGRDECAQCGMLINEERCSAALLAEMPPASGHRRYLLFDDIGCLLDTELNQADDFTVLERYFHDHASRDWVRAEHAVCVTASPDAIPTPMASGMVAFSDKARAQAALPDADATLTDHAGLTAIRRERWEARRRESNQSR